MTTIILTDWLAVFLPDSDIGEALLQIVVRGTVTYWFIFLLLRFFRRGTGQLSISDILLITLISDAAQNAMAGEYSSILEGVTLVVTLVFWDFALNWLGYRSTLFQKIGEPEPVLLIKNGVLQRQNMKRELITEDELAGLLRQQGVDDLAQVKKCYIEGSGHLSVIR